MKSNNDSLLVGNWTDDGVIAAESVSRKRDENSGVKKLRERVEPLTSNIKLNNN